MPSKFKLLTLDNIAERLDRWFLPLEPGLQGYRLIRSNLGNNNLDDLETALDVDLPEDFKNLLLRFDFGMLAIGPTSFGFDGDYPGLLISYNTDSLSKWWATLVRPENVRVIALSDPFTIALDCLSGEVLAFPNDASVEAARIVSRNFSLYLRGIGTTFLERAQAQCRTELGLQVAQAVESKDEAYWTWLAV